MSTLLSDIEAFMATHDMAPTRFGIEALADRHFVRQLRTGRRTWPETEAKVRRFMATYRGEPKATAGETARAA
jgi:hypothetical protein